MQNIQAYQLLQDRYSIMLMTYVRQHLGFSFTSEPFLLTWWSLHLSWTLYRLNLTSLSRSPISTCFTRAQSQVHATNLLVNGYITKGGVCKLDVDTAIRNISSSRKYLHNAGTTTS